uniref:Uncharacterized protein n=1 Tax=Anguilla anguilla TaxID=7936 RepID=A0A0E9W560_ANGAN
MYMYIYMFADVSENCKAALVRKCCSCLSQHSAIINCLRDQRASSSTLVFVF